MTSDEIQKLVKVLATADSGCLNCVSNIAEEAERAFPNQGIYNATMKEIYSDWPLDKPVPDWVYKEQ